LNSLVEIRADSPAKEAAVSAKPLLCEGLSYAYGKNAFANDNIRLSIGPGEILGLLGPNGAGKTTLVRLITGQLRPSAGHISVFGFDMFRQQRKAKKSMGIIPQDVGLFNPLTVRQHVSFFAALKGIPRADRDAHMASVVRECGLEPLLAKKASELSFGQKRKLLVALAFLGNPPLLILDEPTVGLDPVTRRELWNALKRRRDMGYSVLITTHYLDEAEQLSDRIAIIDKGKITACGSLGEFFSKMGKTVVLKTLDGSGRNTMEEFHFDSHEEAHAFLSAKRYANYHLSRVTLEDVYLRYVDNQAAKAGVRE